MNNISKILDNDIPSVIKNYTNLYGKIDITELKVLKNIFDKLDKFELREISISNDGIITDGLMMIPQHKKELDIMSEEKKEEYVKKLMNNINNLEDGYYYKTLIALIRKINYIDMAEQNILNYLFLEIKLDNKKIEEYGKIQNKFMVR